MIPLALIMISVAGLLILSLVNFFNRVQPEHMDLNFLREGNLYGLHILRVLESPDYRYLSQRSRNYRSYLFVSYAGSLKKDVDELAKLPLRGSAYFYYMAFQVFYQILLVKHKVFSGVGDLKVLLGIELMLVRRLAAA